MASIGMVRKIDNMGRLSIPKETRETLDIEIGDALEIFIDDNKVLLKKYNPGCEFCCSMDEISIYKEIKVCQSCRAEIKKYHA